MKFGQRLRSRFWRARVEDEVDAELSFHVEMRARELVEQGMHPADAREAAIRRFGDINRVNATCRAIGRQRDHDMRRTEYFSELTQDVSFACRQLLANPGFTIVSVLTLALGIGATTAIFSAVQSVVLRPLPFPQPDRLVSVYESSAEQSKQRLCRQLRRRDRAGQRVQRRCRGAVLELQPVGRGRYRTGDRRQGHGWLLRRIQPSGRAWPRLHEGGGSAGA